MNFTFTKSIGDKNNIIYKTIAVLSIITALYLFQIYKNPAYGILLIEPGVGCIKDVS